MLSKLWMWIRCMNCASCSHVQIVPGSCREHRRRRLHSTHPDWSVRNERPRRNRPVDFRRPAVEWLLLLMMKKFGCGPAAGVSCRSFWFVRVVCECLPPRSGPVDCECRSPAVSSVHRNQDRWMNSHRFPCDLNWSSGRSKTTGRRPTNGPTGQPTPPDPEVRSNCSWANDRTTVRMKKIRKSPPD